MATNCFNSNNWIHFNSHENQCFEEEEEEEEALSLCDLPTIEQEIDENSKKEDAGDPEDFEFGSVHGVSAAISPENMCNAGDVFFQGQILPLRHSVSSDNAGLTQKLTRSESMSSCVSSTSTTNDPRTIRVNGYKYKYSQKPRIRNQFHSHPSPSPKIRTQSFRTLSHSNPKTSSLWSFLQVGLLKPQEIGLSDLKNRSKRFGSHNSNSSSTSSSMSSTIDQTHQTQNKIMNPRMNAKNTKKKPRLFFGGCKCSANSIESTVTETNSRKKTTTLTNLQNVGEGKQAVSRSRTFEWLKQLSIVTPNRSDYDKV